MGNALRDQLLKSGLVNDKQLKQATKEKRKEDRQKHGQKQSGPDESALRAERIAQEKAQKAERDRELNLQQKQAAEQKALHAQLRQLVETHRQPTGDGGDIAYSFSDGGKVKRLYVTGDVRDRLSAGRLVIVRCDERYELVFPDIAERIRGRDPDAIVLWNVPPPAVEDSAAEDPYAKYQIPDDLIW
jgi:uncharacterized protein YaiL (DUF2058 family)